MTKHLLPLLCIMILALTACDDADSASNPPFSPAARGRSDQSLPRIDLAGIQSLIEQSKQNRQVLVIDFWATWCLPCVQMFDDLHHRLAELGPDVRLVTITLDADETEAAAVRFLERHQATTDAWLLVPDQDARLKVPETLGQRWKDLVVPAILVYGPDGALAGEFLEGQVDPIVARVGALRTPDARAPSP